MSLRVLEDSHGGSNRKGEPMPCAWSGCSPPHRLA
jgi:hypothetical protein